MAKDVKAKKVQEHFMWAHMFTGNVNSNIFKQDVLNPAEHFKWGDAHVHLMYRLILGFLYSSLTKVDMGDAKEQLHQWG